MTSVFMVDKEMIAFVSHQHVRIKKNKKKSYWDTCLVTIISDKCMELGSFDFAK